MEPALMIGSKKLGTRVKSRFQING